MPGDAALDARTEALARELESPTAILRSGRGTSSHECRAFWLRRFASRRWAAPCARSCPGPRVATGGQRGQRHHGLLHDQEPDGSRDGSFEQLVRHSGVRCGTAFDQVAQPIPPADTGWTLKRECCSATSWRFRCSVVPDPTHDGTPRRLRDQAPGRGLRTRRSECGASRLYRIRTSICVVRRDAYGDRSTPDLLERVSAPHRRIPVSTADEPVDRRPRRPYKSIGGPCSTSAKRRSRNRQKANSRERHRAVVHVYPTKSSGVDYAEGVVRGAEPRTLLILRHRSPALVHG